MVSHGHVDSWYGTGYEYGYRVSVVKQRNATGEIWDLGWGHGLHLWFSVGTRVNFDRDLWIED